AASDVYALGVVGYESVSGKRPFTGDGALTVAMKHIKENPPPLPADLPPNVRELIEITLVKNPGMRYRSGGPFADAVAAVRAGRRPPRPNATPSIGRAAPTAVPSSTQARAELTGRAPAPTPRARPTGSHHRSAPPPRRTFSSGQRALLWAAGVLGALAIVIAILIVLNAQDRKDRTPEPPTVTETPSSQASASETPAAAPTGMRGHGPDRYRVSLLPDTASPPTVTLHPLALEQNLR
ncbi:MAG TPA: serine/threonine protein kinase, partial [Mycobacterium sp.]